MGSISNFLTNMNWSSLVDALLTAVAALICLTVHELFTERWPTVWAIPPQRTPGG